MLSPEYLSNIWRLFYSKIRSCTTRITKPFYRLQNHLAKGSNSQRATPLVIRFTSYFSSHEAKALYFAITTFRFEILRPSGISAFCNIYILYTDIKESNGIIWFKINLYVLLDFVCNVLCTRNSTACNRRIKETKYLEVNGSLFVHTIFMLMKF